jgi:hypothetical protein
VVTIVLTLNVASLSLIDYAGQRFSERAARLPTQTIGRKELTEAVLEAVAELHCWHPERTVRACVWRWPSRASPTPRARTAVVADHAPHHMPFADTLERAFRIPDGRERLQHDRHRASRARARALSRQSRRDHAFERHRHGADPGRRLFTGSRLLGGEFGHMIHMPDGALCRCGRHGCIEAYAGNYAIMRNARGQGELGTAGSRYRRAAMVALAARARDEDGPEREAFRTAGRAIGYGLGSLFALIDPAPVAIVGPGTAAFDIIEPALREALANTAGGQDAVPLQFELELDEDR